MKPVPLGFYFIEGMSVGHFAQGAAIFGRHRSKIAGAIAFNEIVNKATIGSMKSPTCEGK